MAELHGDLRQHRKALVRYQQLQEVHPGRGQVNELVAALSKRFGTELRPSVQVNPALIGGVRIAVGDQVLDNSVRARLNQMQTALTA